MKQETLRKAAPAEPVTLLQPALAGNPARRPARGLGQPPAQPDWPMPGGAPNGRFCAAASGQVLLINTRIVGRARVLRRSDQPIRSLCVIANPANPVSVLTRIPGRGQRRDQQPVPGLDHHPHFGRVRLEPGDPCHQGGHRLRAVLNPHHLDDSLSWLAERCSASDGAAGPASGCATLPEAGWRLRRCATLDMNTRRRFAGLWHNPEPELASAGWAPVTMRGGVR